MEKIKSIIVKIIKNLIMNKIIFLIKLKRFIIFKDAEYRQKRIAKINESMQIFLSVFPKELIM